MCRAVSELEEKPSKRAIMDTLASAFASHGGLELVLLTVLSYFGRGQLSIDIFPFLASVMKRKSDDVPAWLVAPHCCAVNVSLVNEVFARFEHFGTITESQFDDMMRSLGVVDGKTIREAFAAFDIDGDGSIDLRGPLPCVPCILSLRFLFFSEVCLCDECSVCPYSWVVTL